MDDGGNVDSIYLDFQKAFDSVPHERLLTKLEGYGITDLALKWIKKFLKERRQQVLVNGAKSGWSKVLSGIPQGSVLGPVLFVIYINDMPDSIENLIQMFTDDTKLYAQVNNDEDSKSLQEDVNRLEEWANKWQIRFNATKCKVMHLGKENLQKPYYMTSSNKDEVTLEETLVEKDLGVYVDKDLSFSHHIQQGIAKANKLLGLIRRSMKYLNKDSQKYLFTSLVRPHLEYGNIIWSPTLQSHINNLEKIQRRATKMVPELKDITYEERMKEMRLPSLAYRRMRGDVIEMYKYTHGIYDVSKKPFQLDPDSSRRNNGCKLFKRRWKTPARTNFFGNRVLNSWNALPSEVVQAPTLNSFKRRLDNHWREYTYTLDVRTIQHKTNSQTDLTGSQQN